MRFSSLYISLFIFCWLTFVYAFKVEADDLVKQLSEPFTPDDAFMFGSQSILALDHNQTISYSKESLSFDEVLLSNFYMFLWMM